MNSLCFNLQIFEKIVYYIYTGKCKNIGKIEVKKWC